MDKKSMANDVYFRSKKLFALKLLESINPLEMYTTFVGVDINDFTREELVKILQFVQQEKQECFGYPPCGVFGLLDANVKQGKDVLPRCSQKRTNNGRGKMMVAQIVRKYLEENGYDGLYGDSCGCGLDDLMPCDGDCTDCEPAYKHLCPGADKCPDADTCESGGCVGTFCYGPEKPTNGKEVGGKIIEDGRILLVKQGAADRAVSFVDKNYNDMGEWDDVAFDGLRAAIMEGKV